MTLDAQLIVPGISVFLQSPYLPNLWLLSSELCLIMKVGLCISQQMKQALVRWSWMGFIKKGGETHSTLFF